MKDWDKNDDDDMDYDNEEIQETVNIDEDSD